LPLGERHHHDPLTVAAREVDLEASLHVVALPGPVGAAVDGLGEPAMLATPTAAMSASAISM
jgi:hypothetical protein